MKHSLAFGFQFSTGRSEREEAANLTTCSRLVPHFVALTMAAGTADPRSKKRWLRLLVAPYLIGIAWTCVHPILSIVTGEAKCRGHYIDENALDPHQLPIPQPYSPASPESQRGSSSLCDSLRFSKDIRDNVDCIRIGKDLQVTRVVPISNAVAPNSETIAIVVPSTNNWLASDFHNAIVQLITRLSQPSLCPWLAKTIMVVSSDADSGTDTTLQSTVSDFVNAYLGDAISTNSSLPIDYTTGILRTLLVVDMIGESGGEGDIRILPQGRQGVLPNMDLVFDAVTIYSRWLSRETLTMHSYTNISTQLHELIPSWLPPFVQLWTQELADMFLFSYNLAMGPYPPHHVALEKGIDSLTIEASLGNQKSVLSMVQNLQVMLQSLSNLHERLHHSVTQYLLPSPKKFVSLVEYLLPNILILLPLVIRAVTLVLIDTPQGGLDLRYCLQKLLAVASCSLALFVASKRTNTSTMNALYAVIYVSLCFGMLSSTTLKKSERQVQSLQFATCLVAIYLHVPLTFAHMSLAFPSSLLWTPLIAFSSFPILWKGVRKQIVVSAAALALAILVTNLNFTGYPPFITTVFLPMHMLSSLLWLS